MAKRGYKLQEFVAHSANVNCMSIGKKSCRLLITGGDDHKVNLWSIGKPDSLMSLCGHASPVESLAFDAAEVLVVAGASTGMIKLWDLEETKMVRSYTGHRSYCTAVQFHPFGEFFASGSMDTNLKIWDIRKKGCIHTYKGHTRGVSNIKFSPDGRWVVSGGLDNSVKVWDLTAGKLLHDFKFHEGHIRSIAFHPLEFLLATGSADKTVKFWDLETFEMIGSIRPEATGVRAITFHPDGRTLFCGLDDSLKVYSWEPVICHDAIDMAWSTLGDFCIHEGKLLGCSHYENSVGVWAADISCIELCGAGLILEKSDNAEPNFDLRGSQSLEKVGGGLRSPSNLRCMSPDYETKEIKNIYVDTSGENPVASQKDTSMSSPEVALSLDSKEISSLPTQKRGSAKGVYSKANGQALNKSFVVPSFVPLESSDRKDSEISRRESVIAARTNSGMLVKPAHTHRPSNNKNDVERQLVTVDSGSSTTSSATGLKTAVCPTFRTRVQMENGYKESSQDTPTNLKSVEDKFEKGLSPWTQSNQEGGNESLGEKESSTVKYVNGVAVISGRTRSLVERFEKREKVNSTEDSTNIIPIQVEPETYDLPAIGDTEARDIKLSPCQDMEARDIKLSPCRTPTPSPNEDQEGENERIVPHLKDLEARDKKLCRSSSPIPNDDRKGENKRVMPKLKDFDARDYKLRGSPSPSPTPNKDQKEENKRVTPPFKDLEATNLKLSQSPNRIKSTTEDQKGENRRVSTKLKDLEARYPKLSQPHIPRPSQRRNPTPSLSEDQKGENRSANSQLQGEEPQVSERVSTSGNYQNLTEDLLQTHDIFLSTLRSRLTKLQVVRHFWERDIKGAINALRKLPDHSVQADVISVLMEKMEILTLDLFSCLLPVLVGLLDSKIERHANISLEMLVKLVAVFGPVIQSTISGPRVVGVDLHAEQRLGCCNLCYSHLQKIQRILPALIRRGGLLARGAQELNLIIQVS